MSECLIENRNRLIELLANIPFAASPDGWERIGEIAISGFIGFGFARSKTNLILVVSTSGRALVNCDSAEKIDRDYEEFKGVDDSGIFCEGIGEIAGEKILIEGPNGGGLPNSTCLGETLRLCSPNWPQHSLYFCGPEGNPLIEKFQKNCIKLQTDFIEAYGFSWCGDYFAIANSANLEIWKRE